MLPDINQIKQALEIYYRFAYRNSVPKAVADKFSIGADTDVEKWLMSDVCQREPSSARSVQDVRSFALRAGNDIYPNMKLRLARPTNHDIFLFSVDSHDAFLMVPPGSPDYEELEEMKKHNAKIVAAVTKQWDICGLMTERSFLRSKILQARQRMQE